MRVQFYPTTALEKALIEHANPLGVSISTLVIDILNDHYGLVEPNSLTDIEIEQRVFKELEDYVKTAEDNKFNEEFDLNQASMTYKNIKMVYAGKPHILKARLGKKFCGKLGMGAFRNVKQVFLKNGKPKKTPSNRAAIYMVELPDEH